MRNFTGLFLLFFLIGSQPVFAAGGGGVGAGAYSPSRPTSAKSLKQVAASDYKRGLTHRDKAWQYEKKAAAETDEKKVTKYEEKAQKEYKKAIKKFQTAIKRVPAFYQAHASLGYALRKTGDIKGSLFAYDNSIKINPAYPEAIENRAETYLQLNRFEDVKQAYMELFFDHPREYADKLMQAMELWQQQNTQVSSEDRKNFSLWFRERQEIAGNTVSLNQPQTTNRDDKI